MRTVTASIALLLAFAMQAMGQVDLTVTLATSHVGEAPRQVGNRLIFPADFAFKPEPVALIAAKTDAANVILWAVNDKSETIELESAGPKEWLLTAPGRWLILATAINEQGERFNDQETVTIGKQPPKPPEPDDDPKPPKPDAVPNDYNVGAISFASAPADEPMAKQLAQNYRVGASYLFGIGGLKDIEAILTEIDRKFTTKQCKDVETCQKWTEWQSKVKAAMIAEQKRRGTFTRQDWYTCLVEVATSLEAVK